MFLRSAQCTVCILGAPWLITPHLFTELKETHLSPLSGFGRSPSTSTIIDKEDKSNSNISGSASPTPSDNNIGKNMATLSPLTLTFCS